MEYLEEQYEIGNYGRVLKRANDLLSKEEYKNDLNILLYKSYTLLAFRKEEEAIVCFNRIIDLSPEKIEYRIEKSLIQINIGKYIEARKELLICFEKDNSNLEVINNLIFIEEEFLNFELVIKYCNQAILIDSNDPSIWLTRGNAYERTGNYEKSISDCNKALELSKDDEIFQSFAYNNLGYTYIKMKKYNKAKYYLEMAIEIYDKEAFPYSNLGFVIGELGNIRKGIQLINKSLQIENNNSYAYKNKAKLLIKNGEFGKAMKNLIKAKKLDYVIDYDEEVNELIKFLENRK